MIRIIYINCLQVVYVTATVPYLLIGVFLWRALTLDGAEIGLKYFFQPKWELLLHAEVVIRNIFLAIYELNLKNKYAAIHN